MLTKLDPEIQNRLGISINEISAFCQQWNIAEMALFGSILREDFQTDSDIDFLISFLPNARQGLLTLAKIKQHQDHSVKVGYLNQRFHGFWRTIEIEDNSTYLPSVLLSH